MSRVRIRFNWDVVRSLPRTDGAGRVLEGVARRMDAAVSAEGGQARVDIEQGPTRYRAAVIAGYEDGATAENTRDQLLRALDAGGADG